MKQSSSSEANSHAASEENSLHFMDSTGSLLYSKDPTTGPYPEPGNSIPQLPILFP
jgi:hypothetical protein